MGLTGTADREGRSGRVGAAFIEGFFLTTAYVGTGFTFGTGGITGLGGVGGAGGGGTGVGIT